jgi:hypothetical protein
VVTLRGYFLGPPHPPPGGPVGAALDALAARPGARDVSGVYRRRVPLGVPLRVRVEEEARSVSCRVEDAAGAVLVDATVAPSRPRAPLARAEGGQGHPLPVSRGCFACGTDNALGLRARLAFDDAAVWCRWQPRDDFRRPDSTLAPIALTTLLDEAAFWLGALATGESGMTTELHLALGAPLAAGAAVVVTGARHGVRARGGDPRYWSTEVVARDEAGAVLASGAITFVAVRGAARRLAAALLAVNPPAIVRRVFPAHVP